MSFTGDNAHKAAAPSGADRAGVWFPVAVSAARTADDWWDFENWNGQSLHVIIDITAAVSSPSVVFKIQGYDPVSDKTWDVLASAAKTGTGTTHLVVSPHIAAAANVNAKDILPAYIRVLADHSNTDSITYSVAAQLVA